MTASARRTPPYLGWRIYEGGGGVKRKCLTPFSFLFCGAERGDMARPTSLTQKSHGLIASNLRRCAHCNSREVHPSARDGLYEHLILRLKLRRPFLCYACAHRFYDSVFN
jgi:hypothetical protein